MKRNLLLILCIMLICLFVFASCNNTPDDTDTTHQHQFNYNEWVVDETHHWYGATCEHTDAKLSLSEHSDTLDNNGECDTCKYDYNHTHTYGDEWTTEGTTEAEHKHYYAPSCGHTIENKDEGTFVDEKKDGICDICDWYDKSHTHTHESEWTMEGTTEADHKHYHKLTCSHTSVGNKDEGEFADENKDGICDSCSWYDEAHTHTHSEEWTTEGTTEADHKHYHAPSCSHTGIAVTNEGTFLDANKDGACDTCSWYDEAHTHTFDETKWEQTTTHHGYYPSCSHTGIEWKDYEEHVDEGDDLYCDICDYDLGHVHTFDLERWVGDYQGHYHPATCEHKSVRGEEAGEQAHIDENKDGICDVCDWYDENHTHTYDEENWTTEGTSSTDHKHYHKASCEHTGIANKDEGGIVDENNDGICDVCEEVTCTHTFDESKYVYDINGHWYKATCGHSVKGSHVDHIGTTEDGTCDDCSAYVDFEAIINNSTSEETASKVLSGTISKVQNVTDATVATTVEYTHGVGYLYIKETVVIDATNGYHGETVTEYWYTLYNNGQSVLGMTSVNGEEATKIDTEITLDNLKGYYFPCSFIDSAYNAYGVEQLIYKFYNIDVESGDNAELLTSEVICGIDSETGHYTMAVGYNGYEVLLTFAIGENNVIENVTISTLSEINTMNYIITQTQGERTATSPHNPESGLIQNVIIKDEAGNVIDPTNTIVIDANTQYYYYLTLEPSDYNKLQDQVVPSWDMDQLTVWYDKEAQCLQVKSLKKGTYPLTLSTSIHTITLSFQVELPAPTTFEPQVSYEDGGYETLTSVDTYIDMMLGINVAVNSGADASFIAEIISGTGASFEYDEDEGYYVFTSSEVGVYQVKLTSTKDETKTAILTINVKEKPVIDVAAILSGKYQYVFYGSTMYEMIFFPESEGATKGTLWYSDLANIKSYTGVYKYEYLNGSVEIYHDDGTVSPNLIMNVSDIGVLSVTTPNISNSMPEVAEVSAKDVLIGKYSITDDELGLMYNIIFTPSDIYGSNTGSIKINVVNESANKLLAGEYRYEYANGILSYTNLHNTVPPATPIPLTIDESFNLLWDGYTVTRINLAPEDVLIGGYEVVKMSGTNINNHGLYYITFDYENGTFTLEDNNQSGWSGTYHFTYEGGVIIIEEEVEFSLVLTPGNFFTILVSTSSASFTPIRNLPDREIGDGTAEYPHELKVPSTIAVNFPGGTTPIYYSFTATVDGTVTIIFEDEDSWIIFGLNGEAGTEDSGKKEYAFDVLAGETYIFGFGRASLTSDEFLVELEIEEKNVIGPGESAELAYDLPIGSVTVDYVGGDADTYVWYAYEAPYNCKLQIGFRSASKVMYGTDLENLTTATRPRTITIELMEGEKLYFAIQNATDVTASAQLTIEITLTASAGTIVNPNTAELESNTCEYKGGTYQEWYTFVATKTGMATITLSSTNVAIAFDESTTQMYNSSRGETNISLNVTEGTTYYIAIQTVDEGAESITFTISIA